VNSSFLLGGYATAKAVASFASVSGVNVTSSSSTKITSSDPNVITVNTNAMVEAVGVGTAQLITTYKTTSVTNTITVTQAAGVPAKPVLTHRYSFSDAAGGTTVKDSVGTSDGTLKGTGGVFSGSALSLNAGADPAYVDLPNGILSSMTNATLEAWVNWNGGGIWQRVFDFGDNSNGEDQQGTGITYFGLVPTASSGFLRFNVTTNSGAGENPVLDAPMALPSKAPTHVAVSYNITAGAVRLYLNGQRVAMAPAVIPLNTLNDINCWLGKSNWNDPAFNGSFDEFRMYAGAMLDADVAADFAAGPDALPGTAKPSLQIVRQGTKAVFSWPAVSTGYGLVSSPTIGAPAAQWTAVNGTAAVVNGQNTVTVDITGTTLYFRLKK
jgi:3D (Asp-Asp-Asp) domain-containing protein